MNYSKNTWQQLKNKTADEIIAALLKDGFESDTHLRAQHIYRHKDGRRVSIHYHPAKVYGKKLLKALLEDIGWTEADLIRLKLARK